jgi:hypothetical protein
VLYFWGFHISKFFDLPITAVLLEVFFFPALLVQQSITALTIWRPFAYAAATWPLVALGTILLRRVFKPQTWWGSGLLWVASLAAATASVAHEGLALILITLPAPPCGAAAA